MEIDETVKESKLSCSENTNNTGSTHQSGDPYYSKNSPKPSEWPRLKIKGKVSAVLNTSYTNRGLNLIPQHTRVVSLGQIHEVICTDEHSVGPGGKVNSIAGVCFLEVTAGGLVVVGDSLLVERRDIGTIIGFDESHMPNHMNIVIYRKERKHGLKMCMKPGDNFELVGSMIA